MCRCPRTKKAELGSILARLLIISIISLMVCSLGLAQDLPNAPSAQKAIVKKTQASEASWPRTMTSGTDTFLVYQPQVEKWDANRVYLYSAVELKTGKDSAAKYGVVWFNARTEVDKINRLVTLDLVA